MLPTRRKWIVAGALITVLAVWCAVYGVRTFSSGKVFAADIMVDLSAEERSWLDRHRNLRLGMWLDSPPLMFRGKDGTMKGLVPAYADIVIKKLGLTPRRVRASSFSALWELARAGEVDVVAAVTAGPERAKEMLLSEPYLYLPIVIVTRIDYPIIEGLKNLKGKRVAVGEGHVPHLRIPDDYEEIELLPVNNIDHGLQLVLAGQADAFVVGQRTVDHYTQTYNIKGVRTAAITEYSYRISFAVRKDWPVLVDLINRAMATISEEERKHINDYWTVLHDSDWIDRPFAWRMVGGVVLAAIVLVSLIMVWNRKLAREVQGRMKAEKKYRRTLENMQKVVESAEVLIVGLDYTGHVKLFNNAAEVITGYSRDEILNKDWFELVVPSERYPFVKEEFIRLLNDKGRSGSQTFENPILTKSGETRHIRWNNSVSREEDEDLAVVSFGTDITDRLMAEEELRLTQFAMDNAAVGVFRVRPSGRIVYANRTAGKMLGYTLGELRKMAVPDIVEEYSRDNWPKFWSQLKYEQMMTFENTMVRKDGKTFPVEVSGYYLLFKGTELAIGFFTDISERKRVEGLRQDVERIIRHDLRSPTMAVQTLFVLLSRADNLTEDQRELLESVMASGKRMLNIIDMSRALYSMEEGVYEITPASVDMLELTESIVRELGQFLRSKKVNVLVLVDESPIAEGDSFVIESEDMLCYGLLANLLKNALEASPKGSEVSLDFSRTEGKVVIRVHNQGVIPESIRATFFEKYVTLGKSEGTGLGTYNARLIATSLGGEIDFETSESGGTTLTVTIPERIDSDS